jgi:hypothetical protein
MYCMYAFFRSVRPDGTMVGVEIMIVTILSPLRQVAILQHIQKIKLVFHLEMLMELRFFFIFFFIFYDALQQY